MVNVSGTLGLPASQLILSDGEASADTVFGVAGKKIDIGKDVAFTLTQEQMLGALTAYPYMPKLSLKISKGQQIKVPRDATIAAKLAIGMKTDGVMDLYGISETQ